jgi:tetratricopeptide (TPR) repeat protein
VTPHAPTSGAWLRVVGLSGAGRPAMNASRTVRGDFSAQLDARWDYAKADVSEARFRQALAQYATNSREALEISTQIARAQGLQRRFDAGHATLDAVALRLPGADTRVRVRYLLERGRLFNSAGLPEQAAPLFREAADLAAAGTAPGDAFYRIDALHMLGIAAQEDERLGWNRKALAAAEAATDARARGWRGSLYHNIGWAHFERGDPTTALDYWQKELAVREAAADAARTRTAKWTVARALRELARLDDAEKIQRALVAEYENIGESDGYVYEELAEIEVARGNRAAAAPWAAKAFAILREDPWFVATEATRLKRLAKLGSAPP